VRGNRKPPQEDQSKVNRITLIFDGGVRQGDSRSRRLTQYTIGGKVKLSSQHANHDSPIPSRLCIVRLIQIQIIYVSV